MRKSLALIAVLVTVVGVAGAAWAATPGVSKDEIKLGVTYVDFEPIKDIIDISHGDY